MPVQNPWTGTAPRLIHGVMAGSSPGVLLVFLFVLSGLSLSKGNTEVLLVHDEGDALRVRGLARKARRAGSAGSAFGTGYLRRPAQRVIDDPVPRDSTQSYFLQMADLNAYAAFRHVVPPPQRRTQIVPQSMWDELGTARLLAVSQLAGGPPGIVKYP